MSCFYLSISADEEVRKVPHIDLQCTENVADSNSETESEDETMLENKAFPQQRFSPVMKPPSSSKKPHRPKPIKAKSELGAGTDQPDGIGLGQEGQPITRPVTGGSTFQPKGAVFKAHPPRVKTGDSAAGSGSKAKAFHEYKPWKSSDDASRPQSFANIQPKKVYATSSFGDSADGRNKATAHPKYRKTPEVTANVMQIPQQQQQQQQQQPRAIVQRVVETAPNSTTGGNHQIATLQSAQQVGMGIYPGAATMPQDGGKINMQQQPTILGVVSTDANQRGGLLAAAPGQVHLSNAPPGSTVIVSPQVLSGLVSGMATAGTPTATNAPIFATFTVQNTSGGTPSTPGTTAGNVLSIAPAGVAAASHTRPSNVVNIAQGVNTTSRPNMVNIAQATVANTRPSSVPGFAPVVTAANAVPLNASKLLQTISTGKHGTEAFPPVPSSPGLTASYTLQQQQQLLQQQQISRGGGAMLSNLVLKPNNNVIPIQSRAAASVATAQVQQVATATNPQQQQMTIPVTITTQAAQQHQPAAGVTHLQYILPSIPAQMTGANKMAAGGGGATIQLTANNNSVQLGSIQLTPATNQQQNSQFTIKAGQNNQLTLVPTNPAGLGNAAPPPQQQAANQNLPTTPMYALNNGKVQQVIPVISSQPGGVPISQHQMVTFTTGSAQPQPQQLTYVQSQQHHPNHRVTVQPMGSQAMTIMTQPCSPVVTVAAGLPTVTIPSSHVRTSHVTIPAGGAIYQAPTGQAHQLQQQQQQQQQKLVLPAGHRYVGVV